MIVENPHALTYLLTEDLYLLADEDTTNTTAPATVQAVEETQDIVPAVINFNAHGGYQQRFLIMVNYPEHELMEDSHFTALSNTITRKGLTIDDIGILNIALYPDNTFDEINDFLKPRKLLILGKNALPAALPAPMLNKAASLNNCQLLYSFSFDEMLGNKENTRAFWDQVKTF